VRIVRFVFIAAVSLLPFSAWAASFNVTTTANSADAFPGNGACADAGGLCSLRAAIEESNAGNAHDITLLAGTFAVTSLNWTKSGTLTGQGQGQTHIVGDGSGPVLRLFGLIDTAFTVSAVSISGGVAPDNFQGGGISVGSNNFLTLADAEVFNNRAPNGAGIACDGICTIIRSYIHDNDAVPREDSVFSAGGGISITGSIFGFKSTVRDSTIENNSAAYGAGLFALRCDCHQQHGVG
jgi:hypothetical protein